MRYFVLFLTFASFAGISSDSRSQESEPPDRSTPAATFQVVQKASKNKRFQDVITSFSKQQKRYYLFETFFAAGMVAKGKKEKMDALFRDSNIDMDSLETESTSANEFLEKAIERIDDLDAFLSKAQQILNENSKALPISDPIDIEIDGDRAIVRYEITISSYSKDENGDTTEHRSNHETSMHMRKYGTDWLICPEQEWKDPEFIWTVPEN